MVLIYFLTKTVIVSSKEKLLGNEPQYWRGVYGLIVVMCGKQCNNNFSSSSSQLISLNNKFKFIHVISRVCCAEYSYLPFR